MEGDRITIELDPGVQPISGWLQQAPKPRQEFQGMVELIALLDEARERIAHESDPPSSGAPAPG